MSLRKITLILFVLFLAATSVAAEEDGKLVIGLVVSDPRDRNVDVEVLNSATDAFFRTKRFRLMERQRLDKIIDEKGLQDFISALTSNDGSGGIEALEGVDMIGLVSYTVERTSLGGENIYISTRLVSVLNGEILHIVDSRREGLYEPSTPKQAGDYLFQNVREIFPPEEYIIRLKGKEAIVGMGTEVGLEDGDLLEVIRSGEVIFHPVTGKPLPGEEIVVGTLKISRVGSQMSTCEVKKTEGALQVGDRVRLQEKDQTGFKVFSKVKKVFKRH